MGKIIIAPEYENDPSSPLVFLAGPVRHAPDWQSNAIALLQVNRRINIASPRRIHGLPDLDNDIRDQIAWEAHYKNKSLENGVILFWLPKPADAAPNTYALTSCFELGELAALLLKDAARVVIGIDTHFTEARFMRDTLQAKIPSLKIHESLVSATSSALEILKY